MTEIRRVCRPCRSANPGVQPPDEFIDGKFCFGCPYILYQTTTPSVYFHEMYESWDRQNERILEEWRRQNERINRWLERAEGLDDLLRMMQGGGMNYG